MRLLILLFSILAFSCSNNERYTESVNTDTIVSATIVKGATGNRKQYVDINSRNDSLLVYLIKFQNERELNELLNSETIIKSDVDSLEVYEFKLKNYIENKFLEINWSMPSGQFLIGTDLYKIINVGGYSKLIRLQQAGFSNRGLYIDSITIYNFKENKLELDPLTDQIIKFRDLSFFTTDTSMYTQLECFDLVYKINPSDNLIYINLQGRPNSCAPGEFLDLEKNNIKETISIGISKDRFTLE